MGKIAYMLPMQLYICSYGHFRTYLKTHPGEILYKCKQCDFVYVTLSNLRNHKKTHTGEKSHKCSQCNFASVHTGSLRTHLKTNSGEKSYKCKQCDFAHVTSSDLRNHKKTYTGEKLHLFIQAVWGRIWKLILEKNPTKENIVNLHLQRTLRKIAYVTFPKDKFNVW